MIQLPENAEILLCVPEVIFYMEPLGVPQMTGYLLENGYPVKPMILDYHFYDKFFQRAELSELFCRLPEEVEKYSEQQINYLAASINTAQMHKILKLDGSSPGKLVRSFVETNASAVSLIEQSYRNLSKKFFGLNGDFILLALAHIQLALDFYFARLWPALFSIYGGLNYGELLRKSSTIVDVVNNERDNVFQSHYEKSIIPRIPAGIKLLGISLVHESQFAPGMILAKLIRKHYPGVHIVLGGPSVAKTRLFFGKSNPLNFLYDSFVTGFGEESVAKLYEELCLPESKRTFDNVPNLVWQTSEGVFRESSAQSTFTVDKIATPVFTDPRPKPILPLSASFGCDWARCKFCAFPKISSDRVEYLTRPVEHVVRDVKILMQRHSPSYIHLCDTNVSISLMEELSDAFIAKNISVPIYSFARLEKKFKDKNFCGKIKRAGFFALHLGIESGSQRVLNKMCKGIDRNEFGMIAKNLYEENIIVNTFLMVGIPTETNDDVEKTIEFLRKNKQYITGDFSFAPYGVDYFSDVYNNPEKYGIDLLHREECDIPLYIPHRKTTGFSEDKVESIMAEICRRVEIPQEYGLRFLMALVDRFGSKNIFEKANFLLYILGGKFRHLLKLN